MSNFSIQNEEYKKREKSFYLFMFEIVLRQDYEDIFFFRDFEVNGLNNNSPGGSPIRGSSPQNARRSGSRGSDGRRSGSPQKYSFHNSVGNQIIVQNQQDGSGTRVLYLSPKKE